MYLQGVSEYKLIKKYEIMDSKEILVSIKCTVYNHEPYLRQCLEGFVMQKSNFRFEAIVHDDASTDGSAAIIREYAEKYPDIIKPIYETENQYSKHDGSLKRIMDSACKGKYIAICEGDDYWIDPLKLQKQVSFMEKNPDYILCGTNGLILWDDGINAPEYFHRNFRSRELTPEDIIGKWPFPTASLLFRRELYNIADGFKCKIYSGDIRLILVALANGRIWSMADVATVYRLNDNPYSSSNQMKRRNDHRLFYYGQMIKLYSAYDEYTDWRFHGFVQPVLAWMRNIHTVIVYRKKIGALAFLIHPHTSVNVTFKIKVYRLIKRWVYRKCHL